MVFWIAILIGGLFAWQAVRLGFYETWGLLFGSIVSIYVAVFLAPSVVEFAAASGKASAYSTALGMIVLAGGCFAILYGLSYVFLTGQFKISFPETFDILLAGGLGFLTGFLLLSFVALVFMTTPLAEHELVDTIGLNVESEGANMACVAWCCDLVHSLVGPDGEEKASEAAIMRLLEQAEEAAPETIDPNESAPPQAARSPL